MRKLLFLLCLPLITLAQDNPVPRLDSLMQAQVSARKFNGTVLVAKSGKIIYQKAFGYSDFNTKHSLDNNSVFELASVSKQFTAMGILLLKQQGKLRLSDSLRQYFPELPYHNITISHLLTHTSGLPDYEGAMVNKWNPEKIAYNADMIGFLVKEQMPVRFQPGTKWEYSNTAYAILASIIEKASGQPYAKFLQQHIFKPLGMTSTRVYTRRASTDKVANYAYGYVFSDSLKRYIIPDSLPQMRMVYFLDGIQGDGTVNSTTGDLFKWDRALKNHTLLPAGLQNEMLSVQAINDSASKAGYGYGVFVGKNKYGTIINHSGGWPGYATMLHRNVDEDVTIIVLSNNNSPSPAIANQINQVLHGEQVILPYNHKEISFDSVYLNRFVGKYQGPNLLEIFKSNGKLYRKGKPDIELKPESPTRLFYADGSDRYIDFWFDKLGNVVEVWIYLNGNKFELKKL